MSGIEARRLALRDALEALRRSSAEMLDVLAAETNDSRFRIAAGILRGAKGGRKPVDDAGALAYAEAQLEAGLVKSRHAACRRAAWLFADSDEDEASVVRRLMRKIFRPF